MISNDFDGYVPRKYQVPTMEDVLSKYRVGETAEGRNLVNKRALKWLYGAAFYAVATLNIMIEFPLCSTDEWSPEEERKIIESLLKDLSAVIEDSSSDDYEIGENEDRLLNGILSEKVSVASDAVAHAGNYFNNRAAFFPEKRMKKAILEARDICDEAVKQPHI
jgi:hypothetical protein